MNYKTLKSVCLASIKDFERFGETTQTKDGIYIHKNTGSKILGVAHLDTVLNSRHFYVKNNKGSEYVINAQLDDRLGVYTLLFTLPKMGIEFDLLLTEGEETGQSTAQYFEGSYNWIFSFDRRGEDVVSYQYDSPEWNKTIESSGFKTAWGSFSDIAFMEHLGVKALNIGTGYYGEHSKQSYASVDGWLRQVRKFAEFYKTNKDTKFPHTPEPYYPRYGRFDWESWGEYDSLYCYLCNYARGTQQIINDIWLCQECFSGCDMCASCENIVYAHEIIDGVCLDCLDERKY
jgi:hypothetical protein